MHRVEHMLPRERVFLCARVSDMFLRNQSFVPGELYRTRPSCTSTYIPSSAAALSLRYCTLPHNTRTAAPATRACAGLSPCACMSLAPRHLAPARGERSTRRLVPNWPDPEAAFARAARRVRPPPPQARPAAWCVDRGRHEAVAGQPADSRRLGQPSCLRSSWWMARASRLHRSTPADSSDTPTPTPSSSWRRCWRRRCSASCSALHSACCRRSVGTVARVCCGGAAVAPGSSVPSNGAAASGAESPPRLQC